MKLRTLKLNQTGALKMNWNQIEGNWQQYKGQVRQTWAKLTDDDLARTNGKREELVGRLQERYGYTEEMAERKIDAFLKMIKSSKAA
jgi:uncharacterized protein YjbJ (UPF0337 family)